MAIFGKKKAPQEKPEDIRKAEEAKTKKVASKKTTSKKVAAPKKEKAEKKEETKASETKAVKNIYSYRVTEKATRLADKNVYVLNVPKETNKIILKADLEKKYKVKVLAINIVNSPKKKKAYRGRLGLRGGGKKAYITLKAGDSIVI